MIHRTTESRWGHLAAHARLPEVQETIRQEMRKGTIRVRPRSGGGIQIVLNSHGSGSGTRSVSVVHQDGRALASMDLAVASV
jgi:hypothetical protein